MSKWQSVEVEYPPVQTFTVGKGWSEKPYILAIDAKKRMAVGFFHRYSTGELGFASAKAISKPTHWMPLPSPLIQNNQGSSQISQLKRKESSLK